MVIDTLEIFNKNNRLVTQLQNRAKNVVSKSQTYVLLCKYLETVDFI